MKWCATPVAVLVLVLVAFVPSASADPSHNTASAVQADCDNGEVVLLNFGTVTNRSHQAFVITSNGTISTTSIYVINSLAFADSTGTTVIFDTAPGLRAQDLVTCTAVLPSGTIVTTRGFFTNRRAAPAVKTSSRQLCRSYGGTLRAGPDQIGALTNPVLWVCNDFPFVFSGNAFEIKLNALGATCVADGGSVLYAFAVVEGSGPGEMDTTCYGPA
jgi:hypothetical protein